MSQPGIGAMLHMLGGGSQNAPEKYYGRKITAAVFDKEADRLFLTFEDGVKIAIWDDGQSCCESRYMTTDDEPANLVGQTLVSIESRDCARPEKTSEYEEEHDVVAVIVQGDKSAITVVTHNEHNGYYGGFGLTITEEK